MKNTQILQSDLEREIFEKLAWEKMNGMIPVITQDRNTWEILMQAYVNREALDETIRTWNATYWSRSKNQLWEKWFTSWNTQIIYEILTDCDNDSLIYKVEQLWNPPMACHTWKRSCFYSSIASLKQGTYKDIWNIFNSI